MADIRVPELGESIVEATIGNWIKQVGESVQEGEAVVELETDKVNVEVISETAGVLQSIAYETGDTVAPGDVIAVVETGASVEPQAGVKPVDKPAAAETVTETPAAAVPATPAPRAAQASLDGFVSAGNTETSTTPLRATPAVRRMALERGLRLEHIQGSGGNGRITEADVLSKNQVSMSEPTMAPAATAKPSPAVQAGTSEVAGKPEERVRMSRRRLTIAKRLVEAQHTAAMLTTFNEVDMSAVMAIRKRRKEAFKEQNGVGLGFMSFFTKAVIGALKTIPALNAEIQGEEMVLKQYYDIGIAVSTESGLVVPVVRDANNLTFAGIEQSISLLASKARKNQLSLSDLSGGTFTITNGGVFGSLLSTPILNAPQVGILGMHKIQERPVAVDGKIELRPMMYLALSYDHRIVDGSEAVRFLVKVKELLEDPEQLLLEG